MNKAMWQSPCEDCKKYCTFPQCEAYKLRLSWQMSYFRRAQREEKERKNVFRYDAPYRVEAWLERGPCPGCPREKTCPDTAACKNYDAWVRARLRRIRVRLGQSPSGR